jgi:hypothetical protein
VAVEALSAAELDYSLLEVGGLRCTMHSAATAAAVPLPRC